MDREKFIKDFIEVYHSFPCLWKVTSPDYNNRVKKTKGYNKLIEVAQKHFPGQPIDVKFVKAKIQNMRTVYKRELNKVESSMRSASGVDDVYTPKLWYYDLLAFTRDQEVSYSSQCVLNTVKEEVDPEYACIDTAQASQPSWDSCATIKEDRNTQEQSSPAVPPYTDPSRPYPHNTRSRKRARESERRKNELLETAKQLLQQQPDEFDHVAQSVACKLRRMTENQRIHYERILTDLNTEGLLGQLDAHSYLGNWKRPAQPPQQAIGLLDSGCADT